MPTSSQLGSYLDPSCPVNWAHPVNDRLSGWWVGPPNSGHRQGNTFRNLVGLSGRRGRGQGTLTGGPAWVGPKGRPGGWSALSFDGTDDYVSVGLFADGYPLGDQTIAAWLRPTSSAVQDRAWFATGNGSSTYGVYLSVTAAGNAHFYWAPAVSYISGGTCPTDQWSHIACTRRGSTRTIYINGVSVTSASDAGTDLSSPASASMHIGRRVDGLTGTPYYSGFLDDIRLYTYGLSAATVREVYEESRRGYPSAARWLPDGTYFATETDAAVAGHPAIRRLGLTRQGCLVEIGRHGLEVY